MAEVQQNANARGTGEGQKRVFSFFASYRALKCGLLAIVALALLPVISLTVLAFSGGLESLNHIAATVLWPSTQTTFWLLAGVAVLTASMGTISAWLVSFYEFPGRRILNWALLLPLAVPTYIAAYVYVEFWGFTGPVQSLVRTIGGFHSARDYWFPNVRSLGGTIVVMSLVLYPYVYMAVRTLFFFQSKSLIESARILGIGQIGIFRRVLLPLARPAIILGVSLALMETINDIGAIEYLGTRTLTFSIFSVWLNRNDISGAAQLSLILILCAFALIMAERRARKSHAQHEGRTANLGVRFRPIRLRGAGAWAAFILCALPMVAGFLVPLYVLTRYAVIYWDGIDPVLVGAVGTSIMLASSAAIATVVFGLVIAYGMRAMPSPGTALLARLATLGYAIPGTIVALGIFLPLARFDNFLSGLSQHWFGVTTGLLVTGSGVTIIYAYAVRFLAMAEGTLDSAMRKLSPRLDQAARSLGKTELQAVYSVLLPILWPAIATAALFVFIDSMKELSATILLRPAGTNTISTYIYDFASRAQVEDAALGCLVIVAIGILPVVLVSRTYFEK